MPISYEDIRAAIKPLSWLEMEDGSCIAMGIEEFRLQMDPDGNVRFWEPEEGPDYTDMTAAKKAVEDYHRDTIMREFFTITRECRA